ncbi:putative NADH-ubiquinone oxidoreductase [Rhodospirillaceae bacterium LM-1]|nr:putative NADH-ubiquinone oxidoreductase [Rhodospirillaceae bacterium LM-1]
MQVRIYRPAKSAMQSGQAKAKDWILEHEPSAPKKIDPLMGWIGSADTQSQVRLTFASMDAALDYAKRMGFEAIVSATHERGHIIKNYADNFRYDRPA